MISVKHCYFVLYLMLIQGSTLECLIKKMLEKQKAPGNDDPYGIKLLGEQCRHEVMRIAELQTDDFHLDRSLYFACRADREVVFAHVFFASVLVTRTPFSLCCGG